MLTWEKDFYNKLGKHQEIQTSRWQSWVKRLTWWLYLGQKTEWFPFKCQRISKHSPIMWCHEGGWVFSGQQINLDSREEPLFCLFFYIEKSISSVENPFGPISSFLRIFGWYGICEIFLLNMKQFVFNIGKKHCVICYVMLWGKTWHNFIKIRRVELT